MGVRRGMRVMSWGWGLTAALAAAAAMAADEKPSALKAAAAVAERIVIAVPDQQGTKDGKVDVPPGSRFAIEVQIELRGSGNKSVLIVNGGDEKQHPRYVNGKQYVFLLKRNSEGKGWLNLGKFEIPIKGGQVQWLADGKIAEEMPLSEFEELAAATIEPVAEKTPTRDMLTGKWVLARSDKGTDFYLWLVEMTAQEGQETKVRLLASNRRIEATRLKSAEISGKDVRLVFIADEATFDFQGRFFDGIVRGTITGGPSPIIIPARMEPTDLTTMRKKYDDAIPDPHFDEFVQAVSQENPAGALTRFIRRHPLSSLTLPAYQALVLQAAGEAESREKFEKLADEYRAVASKWGPRMELQALVDLGAALSVKDRLPDLSLQYLTEAHQRFADDTPVDVRKTVEIERGRRLIAAGREAEGIAVLADFRAGHPFDPMLLYSLGKQAEKDKRIDDALELYGELQVLPLLEQSLADTMKSIGQKLAVDQFPRRLAARLWLEKHGDASGLPEWLENLYSERIRSLAGEKRPPRTADEGNRVVLCELFTGTSSLTSIAADVAISALQVAYDSSEFVVLRYHLHDPAADPLASLESGERFKMYLGHGTPLVVLSGRSQLEMAGPLSRSPAVYHRLLEQADLLLKERTDLKIELSAQANQGKVSVSAKAAGLPTFPPNIRMGVVVVEDKIPMPAKNGIRVHEMVVRAMLAGVGGIGPTKGALEFSVDFELNKMRKQLAKQIADKEADAEAPFDAKPLDLAALHVVAFLQNSETGEVYQATSTPVTGLTANSPAVKPTSAKSSGAKAGESKPASGEK
jgi:hypothetical protein